MTTAPSPFGSDRPTAASSATTPTPSPCSRPSWHVAATGDFNGDGRDDIALAAQRRHLHHLAGRGQRQLRQQRRQRLGGASDQLAHRGHRRLQRRQPRRPRLAQGRWRVHHLARPANGGFVSNDANSSTVLPTAGRSRRPATTTATDATTSSGATATAASPTGSARPTAALPTMPPTPRPGSRPSGG